MQRTSEWLEPRRFSELSRRPDGSPIRRNKAELQRSKWELLQCTNQVDHCERYLFNACVNFERSKILREYCDFSNNDVFLEHVDELPDRTRVNLSLPLLARGKRNKGVDS